MPAQAIGIEADRKLIGTNALFSNSAYTRNIDITYPIEAGLGSPRVHSFISI